MFGKSKNKVAAVQRIVDQVEGGIFKRIDENRELLELMQMEAPQFLANHGWVEGWLKSHDRFFGALAEVLPPQEPIFRANEQFPRQWPDPSKDLPKGWIEHAYPLQQITILLQGRKSSETDSIIAQLETVIARLKAGDRVGCHHDDDYGYRFTVNSASNGPSYFSEAADNE